MMQNLGRLLDLILSLRKRGIDARLAQLHRRGYELVDQLRTQPLPPHEAQRLVVDWIDTVALYIEQRVSAGWSSQFYGDFETIRKTWQIRWEDPTLRSIDGMVQESREPLADAYRDEPIRIMTEKIGRLEEVMRR
jgi:hypothetical protein